MSNTLEFVFDFSSPYAYIGNFIADQLAAEFPELEVIWRPYLMGAAMKITGIPVLVDVPMKGDYMKLDLKRTCEQLGVDLAYPANFPFMSVAVCRAFYALEKSHGQDTAQHFARTALERCFGRGEDLTNVETLAEVAAEMGADAQAMGEAMQTPDIKEHLKTVTSAMIERGCWGSPHYFVNHDRMYWGNDKRWEIRELLRSL